MTGPRTCVHRILHVETNEDGTVGGSYRALHDLVRGLDRSRFEPQVLLYQQSAAAGELRAAGTEVSVWDDRRADERAWAGPQPLLRRIRGSLAAIRSRTRWLRDQRVDLVHLNNSPGVGFDDWLPAARLARVPCITHLRGPFAPAHRSVSAYLQRHFDAVLAVSRWMAESAHAAGLPHERVRIVYDGVDRMALQASLRRPPAELREELDLAPDDFVVLLAGHLRPWKGQDVALEAVQRLDSVRRRRLRLLLAGAAPPGESEHRARLEASARAASLGACVRFLGERSDVPDLMRAADVVLHASTRPEPFGLVVVEAMALGRPVVASRLGGPAEIITEGTGLLFDPSRPEELAFLLGQLAEQPALREQLGSAARVRAEAFDVRHTIDGVERCYADLLGLPMQGREAVRGTDRAAAAAGGGGAVDAP